MSKVYENCREYKKLFDIFHSTRTTETVNLSAEFVYDILNSMKNLYNEAEANRGARVIYIKVRDVEGDYGVFG